MTKYDKSQNDWHVASVEEEDAINRAQAEWYWENKDNLVARLVPQCTHEGCDRPAVVIANGNTQAHDCCAQHGKEWGLE